MRIYRMFFKFFGNVIIIIEFLYISFEGDVFFCWMFLGLLYIMVLVMDCLCRIVFVFLKVIFYRFVFFYKIIYKIFRLRYVWMCESL